MGGFVSALPLNASGFKSAPCSSLRGWVGRRIKTPSPTTRKGKEMTTTAHLGDCLNGCQICADNHHEGMKANCPDCGFQPSISWGELAELTHQTQVERFGFCSCEDNEGKENPYSDCAFSIDHCHCENCNCDKALEEGARVCDLCVSECGK